MSRASGPYTVDASVFLSAFNPQEPFHAESYRFVETADEQRRRGTKVVPTRRPGEVKPA